MTGHLIQMYPAEVLYILTHHEISETCPLQRNTHAWQIQLLALGVVWRNNREYNIQV